MKTSRIITLLVLFAFSSNAISQKRLSEMEKLALCMDSLKKVCLSQQREIQSLKVSLRGRNAEPESQYVNRAKDMESRINLLEKRIKELTGSPFSMFEVNNLEELTTKVKKLELKTDKIQGSSNSYNQPNITDLTKKIENLESRINKISGTSGGYGQPNISDLQKRIEKIESGLNRSFDSPGSGISSLKTKIDDLERRINRIENNAGRASSVSDVSALKSKINDLERKVNDLDRKIR